MSEETENGDNGRISQETNTVELPGAATTVGSKYEPAGAAALDVNAIFKQTEYLIEVGMDEACYARYFTREVSCY